MSGNLSGIFRKISEKKRKTGYDISIKRLSDVFEGRRMEPEIFIWVIRDGFCSQKLCH